MHHAALKRQVPSGSIEGAGASRSKRHEDCDIEEAVESEEQDSITRLCREIGNLRGLADDPDHELDLPLMPAPDEAARRNGSRFVFLSAPYPKTDIISSTSCGG